jgi:hypothetical protein
MPGTETHGTLRVGSVEDLLDRHLGPVRAPAELWGRVQGGPARGFDRRLAWALGSALLILAAAAGVYVRHANVPDEAAAFQALARGADSLELLSAGGPEIRTWVRNQTGMDVPLQTTPALEPIGARVLGPGVVEIDYRVGEHRAALVVTRDTNRDSRDHWNISAKLHGSMSSLSWTIAGQRYLLACAVPADLHVACRICHADGLANTQWDTALN